MVVGKSLPHVGSAVVSLFPQPRRRQGCPPARCAPLVLSATGSMFGMSEPIPNVFPVESRDSMSIADTQLGRGGEGTHLRGTPA